MSVWLKPYKPADDAALTQFYLPEEQLYYTAMAIDSVEKAKKDFTRTPVVIMSGNEPAGMFVLQTGPRVQEYTARTNAILLMAYMIDYFRQGKGVAKESLYKLPDYVRENFPDTDWIVLAVNEKNISAQSLYKQTGFLHDGEKKMGKKGWLMVMKQEI